MKQFIIASEADRKSKQQKAALLKTSYQATISKQQQKHRH